MCRRLDACVQSVRTGISREHIRRMCDRLPGKRRNLPCQRPQPYRGDDDEPCDAGCSAASVDRVLHPLIGLRQDCLLRCFRVGSRTHWIISLASMFRWSTRFARAEMTLTRDRRDRASRAAISIDQFDDAAQHPKDRRDVQRQDDHCGAHGFNQVDHEPTSLQSELARRARCEVDTNARLSRRGPTSRYSVEILLRLNLAIRDAASHRT